jgi:hypothetical protein
LGFKDENCELSVCADERSFADREVLRSRNKIQNSIDQSLPSGNDFEEQNKLAFGLNAKQVGDSGSIFARA